MKLNKLAKKIHKANVEKGFYEDSECLEAVIKSHAPELLHVFNSMLMGQRIALIQSEASEMLEADRHGKRFEILERYPDEWKENLLSTGDENFKEVFKDVVKDTLEDELADTIIRCLDTAGANGIDIDFHVKAKLRYNSLRPKKHGKEF